MIKKSNRILIKISSHAFPFDFFPNSIVVEEGRVTIVDRHFLSSEIYSVDMKNIANVLINTTWFFSQLVIISKTFEENEIQIRSLRTRDAIFVRRIIEGLRVFEREGINTADYSVPELISALKKLSTTAIIN